MKQTPFHVKSWMPTTDLLFRQDFDVPPVYMGPPGYFIQFHNVKHKQLPRELFDLLLNILGKNLNL